MPGRKDGADRPDAKPDARWTYGAFYLDQPHPERGGYFYACRYDAGSRKVARRSLRTADIEEAKVRLVAIADTAPAPAGSAPQPGDVATMTALQAYIDGRGTEIRSLRIVEWAAEIVHGYLKGIGKPAAPVSFWTDARVVDLVRYLTGEKKMKLSSARRVVGIMSAAFRDAAKSKMRPSPFGEVVEGSLMAFAPPILTHKGKLMSELRLPDQRPRVFVPTLAEMATFLDALQYQHLRRWALLALATWARPEAVTDLRPDAQWDRRSNALDLNVPWRPITKKRRAVILAPQALRDALPAWREADMRERDARGEDLDAPWHPLSRGGPVANVVRGVKLTATDVGLKGITPRTPRTFMATHVLRLCPRLPREMRSRWLGHIVVEGSTTTTHYEHLDAADLADVALATDYLLQRLQRICKKPLLAVELRLNDAALRRLGAFQDDENSV